MITADEWRCSARTDASVLTAITSFEGRVHGGGFSRGRRAAARSSCKHTVARCGAWTFAATLLSSRHRSDPARDGQFVVLGTPARRAVLVHMRPRDDRRCSGLFVRYKVPPSRIMAGADRHAAGAAASRPRADFVVRPQGRTLRISSTSFWRARWAVRSSKGATPRPRQFVYMRTTAGLLVWMSLSRWTTFVDPLASALICFWGRRAQRVPGRNARWPRHRNGLADDKALYRVIQHHSSICRNNNFADVETYLCGDPSERSHVSNIWIRSS